MPLRLVVSALLLGALLMCAGCGAVAAGSGSVAASSTRNTTGEIRATFNAGLRTTIDATLAACADESIMITSRQESGHGTTLWGNRQGKVVVITLQRVESDITSVSVTPPLNADSAVATQLLDAVSRHL